MTCKAMSIDECESALLPPDMVPDIAEHIDPEECPANYRVEAIYSMDMSKWVNKMGDDSEDASFPGPDWTPDAMTPEGAIAAEGSSATVSFVDEKIYGFEQADEDIG